MRKLWITAALIICGPTLYSQTRLAVKAGVNFGPKRFDAGLSFLTGFELNNGLFLHGGYEIGLTDIQNAEASESITLKNKLFSISLGFFF